MRVHVDERPRIVSTNTSSTANSFATFGYFLFVPFARLGAGPSNATGTVGGIYKAASPQGSLEITTCIAASRMIAAFRKSMEFGDRLDDATRPNSLAGGVSRRASWGKPLNPGMKSAGF